MIFEDLSFRRPSEEDIEKTLELIIRCDVNDYGEPDTDLTDITHDWGQIDLDLDAWLAWANSDRLVGYSAVLPFGEDISFDFHTDPDWKGDDLTSELLSLCLKRGPGFAADRGKIHPLTARTILAHVNDRDRRVVKQTGFEPGRHYFQLQIELEGERAEPRFPPGVTVRTFVEGQDERSVHELIEAAFAQPDRTPTSYEDWKRHMMRPNLFDPDLWILALSDQEIVGACLCFPYPPLGWVRQLGVSRVWQQKGIGAALLNQAFSLFEEKGFEQVGLAVESKRPDAITFYQRVGMVQVRQYDEYTKTIA